MQVAFIPPQNDLPREGLVDFVRELEGGSFEVGFNSVIDGAAAQGLVGCHCLVKRDELVTRENEVEQFDFRGWNLVGDNGSDIGEVVGLVENPAHPLLEVERCGGKSRALIPLVEEFIVDIDDERRTMRVDLPTGLLEL